MNGRVYDPQLGRFLSADPHVQAPDSVQGLNRYAYVQNNPLKYTDPSGFFFKKLLRKFHRFMRKYARPIVSIAFSAMIPVGPLAGFMSSFFGQRW